VAFRIQGVEHQGEARDASAQGLFVLSQELPPPGHIRLRLLGEAFGLEVPGEVVRADAEGFAVAFEALAPDALDRLNALLSGAPAPEPIAETPAAPEGIPIGDEDWEPPLSRAAESDRRDSDGAAERMGAEEDWESWPTIAEGGIESARLTPEPASEPPAVKPAAPAIPAGTPAPAAAPAAPVAPALERRASERHEMELMVTFENVTSLIKEFTHNISFGGLLFHTDRPVRSGDQVVVTLLHPVNGERLTLPARVARAQDTGAGGAGSARIAVGVEFLLPLPELQRLLSAFISSSQRPAAGADPVVQEARARLARPAQTPAEVLGIDPAASPDEARRAYFALVDRFHPDRHRERVGPDGVRVLEELFRVLTRAYEELGAKG